MDLVIALAIVTGLTQVVKKAGLKTKYIPIVAIVFGILYAISVIGIEALAIIDGIVLGLTSVGLYRTGQKLTE